MGNIFAKRPSNHPAKYMYDASTHKSDQFETDIYIEMSHMVVNMLIAVNNATDWEDNPVNDTGFVSNLTMVAMIGYKHTDDIKTLLMMYKSCTMPVDRENFRFRVQTYASESSQDSMFHADMERERGKIAETERQLMLDTILHPLHPRHAWCQSPRKLIIYV